MSDGDRSYHERRAEMERRMAEHACEPAAVQAHIALAALHDCQARDAARGRPVSRPVLSLALRD